MFKYVEIGRILKPFRTKGELLALVDPVYHGDVEKAKAVFLDINGSIVPFFIENIECHKDTCNIKFEEFSNPEEVKRVNGVNLYLRECDIDWNSKTQEAGIDFTGFMILDHASGKRLQIEEVREFPQQLMAIAYEGDKEYLIPLNEHFILHIDPEAKLIEMDLPQGIVP